MQFVGLILTVAVVSNYSCTSKHDRLTLGLDRIAIGKVSMTKNLDLHNRFQIILRLVQHNLPAKVSLSQNLLLAASAV